MRSLDFAHLHWSAQEKYFMIRVAINYAQSKKDLLWRATKCDLEGIRLDVAHHVLPVLAFVGINDPENGANKELGVKRDDTIGIRKVRVPRVEKGGSSKVDVGLTVDLSEDLQMLPIDGEDAPDSSKVLDGDEYIEKLEFYEPTEEPDAILHRKRTTPIYMGITVPVGKSDYHEQFTITDFWSYEGFRFSETEESKIEYEREAGDPDVDRYFSRRRGQGGRIRGRDLEAQEAELLKFDGASNGKEKKLKIMAEFTEGMERQLFFTKVTKTEAILKRRGAIKLGIVSLEEMVMEIVEKHVEKSLNFLDGLK
ncbi:hypothetical protein SCHPADRAFT_370076 [Schizopora paradoxa]|uniref:Uncharacterized protein n=1 Tax=Schizopora paradoxa TaxID=27342 RepID=A0A0H2RMZ9_9AGAM|nr:hypothetical protein SCHPADRAFT_370076 [Schizopora paradoxa]